MYLEYLRISLVTFANIIQWMIIAKIILSWVTMSGRAVNPGLERFIGSVADPILRFFQMFPHRIGMFDLSPLIALIVIDLVVTLINQLL